jgi:hypothetical protein
MMVIKWRPFESIRCSWRFHRRKQIAGHALQQHVRIAQDRVERRPELVRHVGEELRFQTRRLLEFDCLRRSSSFCVASSAVAAWTRACSSSDAAFNCS